MSTQPAITPSSITTDDAVQNQTQTVTTAITPDEAAARAPLSAPENSGIQAAVDTAREPIRPPEPSMLTSSAINAVTDAGATPHVVAAIPVHPKPASHVIAPEVFAKAESNMAEYLGHKLDPALTKDLLLTFSNILSDSPEGRTGGTDLKFCFKGPMIEANFAEMQREVIRALQSHAVISSILKDNHILIMDQVTNDDSGQMMHLHLPNLTPEQYSSLIASLASSNHVWDHPVHSAGGKAHPHRKEGHAKDEAYEVVSSALNNEAPAQDQAAEIKPVVTKDETAADVIAATEPTAPVIEKPVIEKPEIKDPLAPAKSSVEAAAEVPTLPTPPVIGPTTIPAPVMPPPIIDATTKPKPISSIALPAENQSTLSAAPVAQAVGV